MLQFKINIGVDGKIVGEIYEMNAIFARINYSEKVPGRIHSSELTGAAVNDEHSIILTSLTG